MSWLFYQPFLSGPCLATKEIGFFQKLLALFVSCSLLHLEVLQGLGIGSEVEC